MPTRSQGRLQGSAILGIMELAKVNDFRRPALPLLFDTGIDEASVAIKGSCFLVQYRNYLFVITAAHAVLGMAPGHVMVVPKSGLRIWLRNAYWVGPDEDPEGEYDVIAYDASVAGVSEADRRECRVFSLNNPRDYNWVPSAAACTFSVIGYPSEINAVDYNAGMVQSRQMLLAGEYVGPTSCPTMHLLSVRNPLGLASFDGFSGGPVLATEPLGGDETVTRFCGLAVSGSPASGLVHFLDAEAVVGLLNNAIETGVPIHSFKPP